MNRQFSAWLWRLNNPGVMAAYREIKANEHQFEELAAHHFNRILRHAKDTVPFYRDIEVVGIKDIARLPIMTKEIIRSANGALKSRNAQSYTYWENSSGGSTGEPVRLLQDAEYQRWVGASMHYYFRDMLGCDWSKSRKMDIWGSVEDFEKNTRSLKSRLKNKLGNMAFVNAFRFGEAEMADTVRKMNAFKPEILKGYANSIFDLACFVEKEGLSVHQPKLVNTRTAMVYPEQRAIIERAFGAPVYDFYGSRENSAIAGEVPGVDGRVIMAFNNIVEVVDGEILVTNLHNHIMPLIRYKIMDQADNITYSDNNLPVLHNLSGRVFDYFLTSPDSRVHAQYVITLFFYIDEILSFQVLQKDYDLYTVKYVPRSGASVTLETMRAIESKMKKALRDDIKVDWQIVDEIEKTMSGKHQYVKCEIPS